MADLILMMGVSGSGKSTYAKKFMKDTDIYISRDEIRFSLVKEDEPYFSKEKEVFKTFIENIDNALLKAEKYVIADATHLNSSSRQKVLTKLKNKPENIYVFFINVPLEVALERNSQRTGRAVVPENVIKEMYNSIQIPILNDNEKIKGIVEINEYGQIKEVYF